MSFPKPVRKLFNRPAFATTVSIADKRSVQNQAESDEADHFFSRREPGLDLAAVEEEQRQRRRLARAENGTNKLASPSSADSYRTATELHSPKRRRISHENDAATRLSNNGNHEEIDEMRVGKQIVGAGKKDRNIQGVSPSCPQSDDFHDDSQESIPLPNDDQCEIMRQANPRLADVSNTQIRILTREKWTSGSAPQRPHADEGYAECLTKGRKTRSLSDQTKSSESSNKPISSAPPTGTRGESFNASTEPNISVLPVDTVISLDSDEDVVTDRGVRVGGSNRLVTLDDDSEEDEDMKEHIRQARARVRSKRAQPPVDVSLDADRTEISPNMIENDRERPLIYYWITSKLPATIDLKFKRRSDQRMKEARQYWCKQNNLSDENRADKVVLIWVDRVWYDSMSAEDFEIGVDKHGNPLNYDSELYNGEDPYDGKIHLIAMLESQWEEERSRRLQGDKPDQNHGNTSANTHDTRESEDLDLSPHIDTTAQRHREERIRVTLRAKSYSEQKISVTPSMTVERICSAYRKMSNVPDAKTVTLIFDGESLQPNSTVAQTEIEDMVIVDVHVR